ncbi:septum formation initiator family protein [Streptomyces sp. TRM70350]|uniref:septum formation initiator family protein n=1 Tax=Streptomyces sp. TRM70350 TaxID=2856165 RepID=UPI001C46329D|nr:septum formation initiator family protein [Streptomyces sp. TRM70350]MBV7694886.1 septum formation initiator family protein [Streptomyces sp. TRM70350]
MSRKPELRGRAARLAQLLPSGRRQAARTPFVLLVVLLLGGGLIGLLLLNSALSEGSFQLDDLQKETKNLTDEEQALQRDIDAYSAPEALQRRARELGMVPGSDPAFLNPDGTVKGVPSPADAEPASDRRPLVLAPEAMSTAAVPIPSEAIASAALPSVHPPATPAAPTPAPATPTASTPTSTPRPLASPPAPLPTTPPGR